MKNIDFTIKYKPGRDLTGVEKEIAEATDSEPYALAQVMLGSSGFERTFDPRDYPGREKEVLDLANDMVTAVTLHEALVDTVRMCAQRFREYEKGHSDKGTVDGDAKARRNAVMAERCEDVLQKCKG